MKAITAKEKQVLLLIGRGLSSKQIAQEMMISEHTVASHRKNLMIKLNAKNTADFVK